MSSKSKASKKTVPAAAIKMAKRMGVSLEGFELEAEEIWKKLDDMAANRPVEYQVSHDKYLHQKRFEIYAPETR